MAENLNKYFTQIGPKQPSKVPNKQGGFKKLIKVQAKMICNYDMLSMQLRLYNEVTKVHIPWPEEFFPKK